MDDSVVVARTIYSLIQGEAPSDDEQQVLLSYFDHYAFFSRRRMEQVLGDKLPDLYQYTSIIDFIENRNSPIKPKKSRIYWCPGPDLNRDDLTAGRF